MLSGVAFQLWGIRKGITATQHKKNAMNSQFYYLELYFATV
jgi:hypothetical protein